jgi:hypothetical protein
MQNMEKLPSWATRVVAGPTVRQAEPAQQWDDRKSQSRCVMRRICPRRSGRTWREQRWNRFNREKQMMSDANRLVRPGVVAQGSTTQNGCISVSPSGLGSQRGVARLPACLRAAGPPLREAPSLGLSRVKGNFHARFLGGCEREPLAPTRRTSGAAKSKFPATTISLSVYS